MTIQDPKQRRAFGLAQRQLSDRGLLARAPGAKDEGRDPIGRLIASNQGRVPELVPLRHGRMVESAFSFYRGAAALMAHDLAALPHSGVVTQLCGDAHLANFGFFASPERTLLFDITDFDESLPGPFDWDLRRLAASFAIAARDRGFSGGLQRDAVDMLAEAYRDKMLGLARMDPLEAWYFRLSSDSLLKLGDRDKAELAVVKKARRSTSRVFAEDATESVQGRLMIRDQPPFVYHDTEATARELRRFGKALPAVMEGYRASLPSERRMLLDRYALHDVAVLTPGVGSVGRRCFLLLLVADGRAPLFLQCKEAAASVLAPQPGRKVATSPGQRVVQAQRLMQSASDVFLGWASTPGAGSYFFRQLRDMKASYKLEDFKPADLVEYAQACGYALARAHAKAGDAWTISGYLGRSKRFNSAMVDFARAYADLNEADWKRLKQAVKSGRVQSMRDDAG